jgi:hypothetical protein
LKKLIVVVLSVVSLTANAQIIDTVRRDSAQINALPDTVRHLESKAISFIPPAVFVTYGVLSFAIKPIRDVDIHVYNDLVEDHPNFHYHPENYLQYAPIVMVYGLNLAGIHGKNTFIDRTVLLGMSEGIMALTTFSLKKITHRLRPDGSNTYSFPSGHSGNAFAAAEFMAQEYGDKSPWYGMARAILLQQQQPYYAFITATIGLAIS